MKIKYWKKKGPSHVVPSTRAKDGKCIFWMTSSKSGGHEEVGDTHTFLLFLARRPNKIAWNFVGELMSIMESAVLEDKLNLNGGNPGSWHLAQTRERSFIG
uniref:Uncharacterized protein n=1 Tax=Globodera rostochiensis TaxID=31243 RepID=A0A914GSI7_GLORO